MVKLLDPLGSTEARGAIGGTVYNTWRGISYARIKVTPANPNTPARLASRACAKLCTLRWQLISDLHRSWWNDYAVTHTLIDWRGKPKRISGFNWFLKANYFRVSLGLSIVDTPPVSPTPAAVASLVATTAGSTIVIDWTLTPGYTAASQQVDIWLSRPMSSGRNPKLEDSKHLAFVPAEDLTYTTPALPEANYGIFARLIHEESGLCSPWRLVAHSTLTSGVLFSGPKYPTLGISVPPLFLPWADPTNIYLLDSAIAEVSLDDQDDSDHLLGSHFDFPIPLTATIVGVFARAFFLGWNDSIITLQLRDASGLLGDPAVIPHLGTDPAWISAGSASDLWAAALTPAIVNADGFGLDLTVHNDLGDPAAFDVDVLELTVYYMP